MTADRPVWRGGEITVEPAIPDRPGYGVFVMAARRSYAIGGELTRHLAAWLTAHVGQLAPPADPCAVRLEIDRQRAALYARSQTTDSEDFRAGLAWCDHALDAIAAVAGAPTERTNR
jgi:hypothetical protein